MDIILRASRGDGGRERIWLYRDTGGPEEPAWANAEANDSDFFYDESSATGYFISDRDGSSDVWRINWDGARWNEPQRLPAPVSSSGAEYSPVIAPDGALCFASDREGGAGQGDLYCARRAQQDDWQIVFLGAAVNSEHGEWNLGFSPDGATMLFESSGRASNISVPGDLYVSKRTFDGWSEAVPLSKLNTVGSDLMARFRDDGSVVYTSSQEGDADLRSAPAAALEMLAPSLAAIARSTGDIVLLDPQTLGTRGRIKAGVGPHEIASTSDGRLAVIPLHGVFPRAHDEPIAPSEMQWVSRDSEGYAVIDLVTGEVETRVLENCPRPHGAAITAQGARAWITCERAGEIREIDPRSGETARMFNLSEGVHKVMLLEKRNMLVASNPETDEAYLIDLADGAVETFKTGNGAEALAASADEDTVWVANSFDKTACAIDVATKSLQRCHPTGGSFPIALAVDDAAGRLWVLRNASSDLAALSLDTGALVEKIALPSRPLGMAFDATNRYLYVTLPRRNEVVRINADTGNIDASTPSVMEGDDLDLIPSVGFASPPDT